MNFFTKLFGKRRPRPTDQTISNGLLTSLLNNKLGLTPVCRDTVYTVAPLAYYEWVRDSVMWSELSRLGIVRWQTSFDCNHLADAYVHYLNTQCFVDTFHYSINACAACGTICYTPDAQPNTRHCVAWVVSYDSGLDLAIDFVDPQSGPVVLSARELRSAYGITN